MPRFTGSSSSINSIARTFGAPDKVPAGKVARNTSRLLMPVFSVPSTFETICWTWEYFSMMNLSVTFTLPISAIRPMSLRARSISITCSAISLGSASNSSASLASSSGVAPRGRVPANGRIVTLRWPSRLVSLRTKISGELPTICISPKL